MAVQDFLHDETLPLSERLKLIREIHHAIGTKLSDSVDEWLILCDFDRRMIRSARCWGLLLVWDLQSLQKFHAELIEEVMRQNAKRPKSLKLLVSSLFAVPDLIHSFVFENPEGGDVAAAREMWETRARDRDNGVCVLTGASACEASYVIPRQAENEEAVPWPCIFRLTPQLGSEALSRRLMRKLEPSGGLTDTAANVITFSGPLKHMWEQGRFALEPVAYETRTKPSEGAATRSPACREAALRQTTSMRDPTDTPAPWTRDLAVRATESTSTDHDQAAEKQNKATQTGIKLRFHWLWKTNLEGLDDDPPSLDSDPRLLSQEWEDTGDECPVIRLHGSDGTLTIWDDDFDKLDFLQLRWFAMRLYCLTGAADPDLYIPPIDNHLYARLEAAMERAKEKIDKRCLAEYGDAVQPDYKSLAQSIIPALAGEHSGHLPHDPPVY